MAGAEVVRGTALNMGKILSDAELVSAGASNQRLLRRMEPSRGFVEGEIQHMIVMVGEAVDELLGKRPAKWTLNRPSVGGTSEGRQVIQFFLATSAQAEALDLPLRKPSRCLQKQVAAGAFVEATAQAAASTSGRIFYGSDTVPAVVNKAVRLGSYA